MEHTSEVSYRAFALHVVQYHARIVGARHHLRAVFADAHAPNAEPVAQPHRNVLLSAGAHVAKVERGVDGRVDEVAAVARKLHVGDGPLRALSLNGFDGLKRTGAAASKRQQRDAVARDKQRLKANAMRHPFAWR